MTTIQCLKKSWKLRKKTENNGLQITWVSQDAGLKAAPGRFSQVEDFFHARSSSLVVPHLAKPFSVVGNALTTRQKNEAIIQAIKNNYI